MSGLLQDKVAFITGGNSGIGRATAIRIAQEGAKVVIAARSTQSGEAVVQEIQNAGGEALFIKTQVNRAEDLEAAITKTVETFGQLNLAFNNAGMDNILKPLTEQTEETWDAMIDTNLKGVWLSMKYEIPEMLKVGEGAIVNMSSIYGVVGTAMAAPYVASKWGVTGLTKAAALEFAGQSIRINAVAPGGVITPMVERFFGEKPTEVQRQFETMHPIGRLAQPIEVAEAVVWLLSNAASFVTGHVMVVDGGYTTQ